MNYRIQEIEPEIFLVQWQDKNIWRYLLKECVVDTFPTYIVNGYPVLMFSSLQQAMDYIEHLARLEEYKVRFYNISGELING